MYEEKLIQKYSNEIKNILNDICTISNISINRLAWLVLLVIMEKQHLQKCLTVLHRKKFEK